MDIALITTIILAFIGYIVKYVNDTISYQREKKLALINQRLDLLYGPLYFQIIAGRKIEKMLLKKFGMKDNKDTLQEKYYPEWRLFVVEVLMPLNLMREKIILDNSYLIIESTPPNCFSDFITHVASYKVVVTKWKSGDFSENFATAHYPKSLEKYITRSYKSLKNEQTELIGKRKNAQNA